MLRSSCHCWAVFGAGKGQLAMHEVDETQSEWNETKEFFATSTPVPVLRLSQALFYRSPAVPPQVNLLSSWLTNLDVSGSNIVRIAPELAQCPLQFLFVLQCYNLHFLPASLLSLPQLSIRASPPAFYGYHRNPFPPAPSAPFPSLQLFATAKVLELGLKSSLLQLETCLRRCDSCARRVATWTCTWARVQHGDVITVLWTQCGRCR